ncbi:MAG: putative membrane protein [Cognaticolwellia sp.]
MQAADDTLGAGFLLLTIVCSYLLIAGLSVPLILQKVPPNRIYGFRSKRTLADEQVWYRVNRLGGVFLLLSSLVTLVAASVPMLSAWPDVGAAAANLTGLVIASAVVMVIGGVWILVRG